MGSVPARLRRRALFELRRHPRVQQGRLRRCRSPVARTAEDGSQCRALVKRRLDDAAKLSHLAENADVVGPEIKGRLRQDQARSEIDAVIRSGGLVLTEPPFNLR